MEELYGSPHLLDRDKMYLASVELLVHRLPRFPASRGHDFSATKPDGNHRKRFQFSPLEALRLWGILKKPRATEKSRASKQKQGKIDFPLLPSRSHSNEGSNVTNINIFPFLLNLSSYIQITEWFSLPSHGHVHG